MFRNFQKVFSGSVVSQLIVLVTLPYLTTIYRPSELGFYGLCLSIVSIIGMSSSLRLERALFRLFGKDGYSGQLNNSLASSLIISCVLSGFVYLLSYNSVLEIELSYIKYIFLWSWACSVIQILTVHSASQGNFGKIGVATVLRSSILVLLQICLVLLLNPQLSLILAGVISAFVASLLLISRNCLSFKSVNLRLFFKDKINRKDAFNGFLQSIFSALNNNIAIILIATLFGMSASGVYLLAEKLIRAPINLISNNLRPVVAKHYQSNESLAFMLKLSCYLVLLAFLIVVCTFLFIGYFIENYLGSTWSDTEMIIKILSLWLIPNFICLPFQTYNLYYLDMRITTYVELFSLCTKVGLLIISYILDGGVVMATQGIVLSSLFTMLLVVFCAIKYKN
jgi:lipopolysaccharide exporter